MNDALTGTELAHSLTLERDAVNAFVAILQREQDALIQGRSEDLDSLASSKARMVKQLAEFGERRNRYLASRGLAPDSKGMDAWLAESPASAERSGASAAVWSDLLRLARFAQQLNQTNGAIIATRLQNCQRAFAALQGAAGTTALYGPKGQTFGVGSRRALGFR